MDLALERISLRTKPSKRPSPLNDINQPMVFIEVSGTARGAPWVVRLMISLDGSVVLAEEEESKGIDSPVMMSPGSPMEDDSEEEGASLYRRPSASSPPAGSARGGCEPQGCGSPLRAWEGKAIWTRRCDDLANGICGAPPASCCCSRPRSPPR